MPAWIQLEEENGDPFHDLTSLTKTTRPRSTSSQGLEGAGASLVSGVDIQRNTCAMASEQQWSVVTSGSSVLLKNRPSRMCIKVASTSTAGAENDQATCADESAGRILQLEVKQVRLPNLSSGKDLDIYGSNTDNGSDAEHISRSGGNSQRTRRSPSPWPCGNRPAPCPAN